MDIASIDLTDDAMSIAHGRASRSCDALLRRAAAGQWSIADAIDWTLPPAPPRFLRMTTFAGMVAALEAGERATAEACRRMMPLATNETERRFLALQVADEERHAASYAAYRARLDVATPAAEGVAAALAALADWRGPPAGQVVAVHIVLEGEALRLQRGTLARVRCPLFAAINRLVARDEARHMAFGRIAAPILLSAMDAEEKAATVAETHRVWRGALAALATDRHLPGFLARTVAAERWAHHARVLDRLGLPALRV